MKLILFLSIILTFASCAPATVANQPCVSVPSATSYSSPRYNSIPVGRPNFIWPTKGEVINSFGENVNHVHNKGINIKVKAGETIIASEAGKAIYASRLKGWGKTLILEHANNFYSVYANLDDIFVREGYSIKKGEAIGKAASSGSKGESVLHFEIRKRYCAENPLSYLKHN